MEPSRGSRGAPQPGAFEKERDVLPKPSPSPETESGTPLPPVPRYGSGALADLTASILGTLGVSGATNPLELAALPRACVLVIDGLGWELLRAHPNEAPFLNSCADRPLTAGLPATTATSLGSLSTGLPPGGHGLLGVQVAVPGTGRLLNCLRWQEDLAEPTEFQPAPTVYERAAMDGVATSYVALGLYQETGLSRATTRGATYISASGLGQLVAQAEYALRQGDRAYVTVYHADLDSTGHQFGCGSPHWRHQLRFMDLLAQRIAEILPPGAALYVTGDHGMTDPVERVDVDTVPDLAAGVAMLGGDARCRYVYTEPGAEADVLAAWRATLGDRAWVMSRAEAVAAGWFGPVIPALLPRIGDVVAVPFTDLAIVASVREPWLERMVGMHGSLVSAEQLVPLVTAIRE
ncbi:alkaline phosphatase family protein [Actinomadura logoneensis]|uniref:Alkaline phosphatase family protein n=1 Tax=Actinomadura logoneensis TaxID=2293572 RepID=A0A372JNP9_9ACTN|nr:alkaline phosphatase family protein [Actinomadura logoneensis]